MDGYNRSLNRGGDITKFDVMVFRLQAVDVQASYPFMIKLPGLQLYSSFQGGKAILFVQVDPDPQDYDSSIRY